MKKIPYMGNVFKDAHLPDADLLLIKAKLVMQIDHGIKKRNLNLEEAAAMLSITHARLSLLLNGNLSLFSMDCLVDYFDKLAI